MKYLEYDKASGRIICELISEVEPVVSDGHDYIEIGEGEEIDTSKYAVRDGVIEQIYETQEERLERERLRKQRMEEALKQVRDICNEYVLAQLDGNEEECGKLEKEFKKLKRYI